VIEASNRHSRLPSAAKIDHQAAVVLQNAAKLLGETAEPLQVVVLLFVSIVLLAREREWRACHNQGDTGRLSGAHDIQAVAKVDAFQSGPMK